MKLKLNHYRVYTWAAAVVLVNLFFACRPDDLEEELGPAPIASFTATALTDNPNKIVVEKTSTEGFMHSWDFGNGQTADSKLLKDTIHYAQAGEYTIALTIFGKGGATTTTQIVKIESDDKCSDQAVKHLTGGCSDAGGKTWVLMPEANALVIASPTGETWWGNNEGDVAARACIFNDEYTFKTDGNTSSLVRKMNGDFWVDSESDVKYPADMPAIGCFENGQIPSKYDAWKDGNFTFEVAGSKLKVSGNGVYLGLYKAGEGGTTDKPEAEIQYEIVSLTADKLVVRKVYEWGRWTFTFVPKVAPVEPGNILKNSELSDNSSWTVFKTDMAETQTEFKDGALVFSNGAGVVQTNIAVFQAVEVKADQKYKFSADIKGAGANNSWLEIYFGETPPAEGSDYKEGLYTGLNTWDGCGAVAFDTDLASFGCKKDAPGNGKNGEITFTKAGTIYVVLKVGSWDGSLGAGGISIDNVKLVEVE